MRTVRYDVRSKSPVATENLLENTDGVLRPPLSVLSGWQPPTSILMLTAALLIGAGYM